MYVFFCIMAYADKKAELLHNDLSPSNVMFYFGVLDDVHRVFIGVIDCGRASRPKEKIHFHYAIQDEVGDNVFWLCIGGWIHLWFL